MSHEAQNMGIAQLFSWATGSVNCRNVATSDHKASNFSQGLFTGYAVTSEKQRG